MVQLILENLSFILLSLGTNLLRLKTFFLHTNLLFLINLAAPRPSSTTSPSLQRREYKPRSTRCQSISRTTTKKSLSSCWVKESSNLQPLHTALRLPWSESSTIHIGWPLISGYSTPLLFFHAEPPCIIETELHKFFGAEFFSELDLDK